MKKRISKDAMFVLLVPSLIGYMGVCDTIFETMHPTARVVYSIENLHDWNFYLQSIFYDYIIIDSKR